MGLLITIAVLAILFLIALKLFTVKKVVVEGNELYDQKTIEDAVLNDKYSWNSLYVYLKYTMKSRLMNFRKRTIIIWPKSHK